jgi:uncharacterized protein
MEHGVIDLLRSHANYIKANFAVKRIGLFGSFARGEQKVSSDIDILVEFEKPTFRNFMNLSFYLEDLLGREVDLVTVKGLHSRIRPYVEKDGSGLNRDEEFLEHILEEMDFLTENCANFEVQDLMTDKVLSRSCLKSLENYWRSLQEHFRVL